MDKKMKNHYQMPTIKVVAFKVEMGQMASPPPTNLYIGEQTEATGTQRFGKEVWYQAPSSSSSED